MITQAYEKFYDPKFIQTEEEQTQAQMLQSFASNTNDDVDKIKYQWVYFLPCALALNGGNAYWEKRGKAVFSRLQKDLLITVRKSLAASLVEIVKLIDLGTSVENQRFIVEALQTFNQDIDEVKSKLTPKLCEIICLFPEE